MRRGRTTGEPERIRAMYGSQLVRVHDVALPTGPVAEVATISALADLAKRYESMIMHLSRPDGDAYLVWDNGMLYRYRPQSGTTATRAERTVSANGTSHPRGKTR